MIEVTADSTTDANGIVWQKATWKTKDGNVVEFTQTDILHLIPLGELQPELALALDYDPLNYPTVVTLVLSRWPTHTKVRATYMDWHDPGENWQAYIMPTDYDGDGSPELLPTTVQTKLLYTYPNWRIDKDWEAVVYEIIEEFVLWFKEERFATTNTVTLQDIEF